MKTYSIESFLTAVPEHTCDVCGHRTNVRALGGNGLKLVCDKFKCDCYPSCAIVESVHDGDALWKFPDGTTASYRCPECGGDIERTAYDDGCGFVDVNLSCVNCDVDTWE